MVVLRVLSINAQTPSSLFEDKLDSLFNTFDADVVILAPPDGGEIQYGNAESTLKTVRDHTDAFVWYVDESHDIGDICCSKTNRETRELCGRELLSHTEGGVTTIRSSDGTSPPGVFVETFTDLWNRTLNNETLQNILGVNPNLNIDSVSNTADILSYEDSNMDTDTFAPDSYPSAFLFISKFEKFVNKSELKTEVRDIEQLNIFTNEFKPSRLHTTVSNTIQSGFKFNNIFNSQWIVGGGMIADQQRKRYVLNECYTDGVIIPRYLKKSDIGLRSVESVGYGTIQELLENDYTSINDIANIENVDLFSRVADVDEWRAKRAVTSADAISNNSFTIETGNEHRVKVIPNSYWYPKDKKKSSSKLKSNTGTVPSASIKRRAEENESESISVNQDVTPYPNKPLYMRICVDKPAKTNIWFIVVYEPENERMTTWKTNPSKTEEDIAVSFLKWYVANGDDRPIIVWDTMDGAPRSLDGILRKNDEFSNLWNDITVLSLQDWFNSATVLHTPKHRGSLSTLATKIGYQKKVPVSYRYPEWAYQRWQNRSTNEVEPTIGWETTIDVITDSVNALYSISSELQNTIRKSSNDDVNGS